MAATKKLVHHFLGSIVISRPENNNISAKLTDKDAARWLKFISSSRREMSENLPQEDFRKSTKRVVGGALPAFFDFSDCSKVNIRIKVCDCYNTRKSKLHR